MEVVQVLHMNGGIGETSYANNSLVQKKVIALTKPIMEEAIVKHYTKSFPQTLAIADMGCSSGPNTLLVVSELLKVVHDLSRKLGRPSPDFQVHLNDLPGNDFNSTFRSLPIFQQRLSSQLGLGSGQCFIAGVPGSFYGRLFPAESLNFVHSSYSLQWLSKVPEGVENNKGNIYMARTSPPNVINAYKTQFERDFSIFLKCRSEELVAGGQMVLTFLGRKSEDPSSKEGCYIWELFAMALNEMVSKGTIAEEKMDSFNIPQYTPCSSEVRSAVLKEGSFAVDRLEVTQVNWDAYDDELSEFETLAGGGYNVAKCMRAVAEPLLISHFGGGIIDEVFRRYREILVDCMSKERTQFINVTISLAKRPMA